MSVAVKLYHSSVFLVIFTSFVYNHLYVKLRPDDTLMTYKGYGGKFKYLTFWYFVSNLVADFKYTGTVFKSLENVLHVSMNRENNVHNIPLDVIQREIKERSYSTTKND